MAYQCAEVSQGGEAVTGADWGVNHVSADSANPQNRKERLEVLLGAELGVGDARDLVLESDDVFAVERKGLVREVCHKVETGGSAPVRQLARRDQLRGKKVFSTLDAKSGYW